MIRSYLRRCLSAVLVLLVLTVLSVPIAYSAENIDFSLSDTEVSKNRLFELTLTAHGEAEVSAFVAELTYDSEKVEYRSASVLDSDAEHSVNSTEDGKITAVFLCEDGVACTDSTGLMTFEFKAITSGNTEVRLTVRDVISPEAQDIVVGECTSSVVTVVSSLNNADSNDPESENSDGTEDDESEVTENSDSSGKSKGTSSIGGVSVNTQTVLACVLAVLCVLCVVGYVAYRLGVRNQKEKDKPPALMQKSKEAEDNEKSDD